jgi:hypothetical protein
MGPDIYGGSRSSMVALRRRTRRGIAVTIYLFTAAAAALVAALAGVILVFVIGGQTPQLRIFRREAGLPLRRTWVAVVAEPFVAVFLGVIAANTQLRRRRVGR